MADAEKKAKRTDTVRAARSNVITVAKQINEQYAETGDVDSSKMVALTAALSLLDERLVASQPAKAAA